MNPRRMLLALMIPLAAGPAEEPDRIWLRSGEVINASCLSFGRNTARITADWFENPDLEVAVDDIREWSLPNHDDPVGFHPVRLVFAGGQTLCGTPIVSKEGLLEFETFWGQRIRIESDRILAVERLPVPEEVILSGPIRRGDWIVDLRHGLDPFPPGDIQFLAGRLYAKSLYQLRHLRPMPTHPRTKIEIGFRIPDVRYKSYDLQFHRGIDGSSAPGTVEIGYGQGDLRVSEQREGHHGPPPEKLKLDPPQTRYLYEVFTDRKSGEVRVYLNRRLLREWRSVGLRRREWEEGGMEAVGIRGTSSPFPAIVEHFQVTHWNGKDVPPDSRGGFRYPHVEFRDYRRETLGAAGMVVAEGGKIRLEGGEEKPLELTLAEIRAVRMTDPSDAPAPAFNLEIHSRETGDILKVESESFDGRELTAGAAFTPDVLRIPARHLNLLRFPPFSGNEEEEDNAGHVAELTLANGDRLPVEAWRIDDGVLGIRCHWNEEEIRMPVADLLRLHITPKETYGTAGRVRVDFRDGSFAYGAIPEIGKNEFQLSTSWGQTLTCPLDRVYSIERPERNAGTLASLHGEGAGIERLRYDRKTKTYISVPYLRGESIQEQGRLFYRAPLEEIPEVFMVKMVIQTDDGAFPRFVSLGFREPGEKKEAVHFQVMGTSKGASVAVHSRYDGKRGPSEKMSVPSGSHYRFSILIDRNSGLVQWRINGRLALESALENVIPPGATHIHLNLHDSTLHDLRVVEIGKTPWHPETETGEAAPFFDPSVELHHNNLPRLAWSPRQTDMEVWGPAGTANIRLNIREQTGTHLEGTAAFTDTPIRIPNGWIRQLVADPEAFEAPPVPRPPWVPLDYALP